MPKPDLLKLIVVVKAKLAALPEIDHSCRESFARHREAAEAALADLARDHGARWSNRFDAARLSMAGVKTSCTSGLAGLLRNWIAAAYRRLDKEWGHG